MSIISIASDVNYVPSTTLYAFDSHYYSLFSEPHLNIVSFCFTMRNRSSQKLCYLSKATLQVLSESFWTVTKSIGSAFKYSLAWMWTVLHFCPLEISSSCSTFNWVSVYLLDIINLFIHRFLYHLFIKGLLSDKHSPGQTGNIMFVIFSKKMLGEMHQRSKLLFFLEYPWPRYFFSMSVPFQKLISLSRKPSNILHQPCNLLFRGEIPSYFPIVLPSSLNKT